MTPHLSQYVQQGIDQADRGESRPWDSEQIIDEGRRRAMKAHAHQENVESIRRGVESMGAGNGMSLDESQRKTEAAIREHSAQ